MYNFVCESERKYENTPIYIKWLYSGVNTRDTGCACIRVLRYKAATRDLPTDCFTK